MTFTTYEFSLSLSYHVLNKQIKLNYYFQINMMGNGCLILFTSTSLPPSLSLSLFPLSLSLSFSLSLALFLIADSSQNFLSYFHLSPISLSLSLSRWSMILATTHGPCNMWHASRNTCDPFKWPQNWKHVRIEFLLETCLVLYDRPGPNHPPTPTNI